MSNSATIFVEPAKRGRPVVRSDQRDLPIPPRLALVPAAPPHVESEPVDVAEVYEKPRTSSVAPTTDPAIDTGLLAILDRPIAPPDTLMSGFSRKEAELRAAFAALTVDAARALHKRLTNPVAGDVLAQRFNRLTIERRTRLITFLGDARRRAALANGKR